MLAAAVESAANINIYSSLRSAVPFYQEIIHKLQFVESSLFYIEEPESICP
jgi:hypothetical protein